MADEDRITGRTSNVRQLFTGRRYTIDTYQREYSWETKHVEDLIQDLSQRFLGQWGPLHERRDVQHYQSYFLGPIITTASERINLIDGQQRLTTLTLLLIFLRRLQEGREDAVADLGPLVYSQLYGEEAFTLDIGDRRRGMTAVLRGQRGAAVLHRLAARAGGGGRDRHPRRGDRPGDLRDDERPGPAPDQPGHAQELPGRAGPAARPRRPRVVADQPRVAGRAGPGRAGRPGQVLAARPVRPRRRRRRGHRHRGAPVGTPAQPGTRAVPAGGLPRLRQLRAAPGRRPVPATARRGPPTDPRPGTGLLQRLQQAAAPVPADPVGPAGRGHRGRVRRQGPDGGRVPGHLRGPVDAQLPGLPAGPGVAADPVAEPGAAPDGGTGDGRPAGRRADRAGRRGQPGRGVRAASAQPVTRQVPAGPDDRVGGPAVRGRARLR
ncbi:MAG: DUF262 domain-containing protein, partial [Actinobacteria bacterium]